MRLTIIQLLLLIAIASITSCSGQSLTGGWKLVQVDLMQMPNQQKRFTIDLTKPDKVKADLYEQNLLKELDLKADSITALNNEVDDRNTTVDVNEMKTDIDKYVASLLTINMTLSADNKFQMRSNGLIVPTAIPGWHFGDTLQGNWMSSKDTLFLSIGDEKQAYTWKFKILQVTNQNLRLQEVFDGFEGKGNELRFIRQ